MRMKIESNRDMPLRDEASKNDEVHFERAIPTAPPKKASSILSVIIWRINRDRPAPIEFRIASSRERPTALASNMFAKFTHATNNTIAAKTNSR